MTPDTAMIFAAGHGTRMRELTRDRPKPLIEVAGRTLLDRALDLVDRAGIARKIVNTHYLGQMISAHLATRLDVTISHEPTHALETGGGMKKALPLLGEGPVFTLNPDAVWTGRNPLSALAEAWSPGHMQGLLMLVPLEKATAYRGKGDFTLDQGGRIIRFRGVGTPLVFTGAQIIATGGLGAFTDDVFSINLLWDQMIEAGQLFGIVHPGSWADVGTPEGIVMAEALLREAADV